MVPPLLISVISSTVLFAALVTPPRVPPPRAIQPPRVFMAAEQPPADTASPPPAAPPAAPPEKEPVEDEDRWLAAEPVRLVSKSGASADTLDDAMDFDSAVNRVLVIYTGGTLGMTMQDGSLAPKKGFLQKCIVEMPEVHAASMPELDLIEYDPLIDSSNISPKDWSRLARQIRDNYYDYDGFVILHGTDTMAYTASALSFMLEGLGKAVVLTGSMIPLAEVYNDARRNLLISMVFAAQLELCEVAIFFDDRLLRGNRAHKIDSSSLSAFDSPNFPPLATVGATIDAERTAWRAPPTSRLRVHTNLDASVVCISLAPGFDDSAIVAMIEHASNLKGLVLSLYGTGNGPAQKAEFLSTIQLAIDRGILVVAATQCTRGTVSLDTYEVGCKLLDLGVVSAGDMTIEACVTKIAYVRAPPQPRAQPVLAPVHIARSDRAAFCAQLLGRNVSGERLRKMMVADLRGELTVRQSSTWRELSSLGQTGQIRWKTGL